MGGESARVERDGDRGVCVELCGWKGVGELDRLGRLGSVLMVVVGVAMVGVVDVGEEAVFSVQWGQVVRTKLRWA